MKKLKIALTLLFALSCSLFLFACGGKKYISSIELSGQKTTFTEGDAFDPGDLKVVVYYQGQDKGVELKDGEYTVDSSLYNPNDAGDYQIKVIPSEKVQLVDEGAELNYATYYVNVDHKWESDGNGTSTCPCGAKKTDLTGLTSKVTTVAWGSQATYDAGTNGYSEAKAPISGENHVALGVLVAGQSATFTLKIDEVDTGATWNTPLMGIRDGASGTLPREDKYVIGTAAGYVTPDGGTKDAASTAGAAAADSTPWLVYSDGETWNAADLVGGTVVVYYNYQLDGIFMIRHTLTTAAGATRVLTYTVKVPDSGYELVAYGEKVTYTITAVSTVQNRYVTEYTATAPTQTVQPEGKFFDKTGINTTIKFSKGNDIVGTEGKVESGTTQKATGNFYAYKIVASEIDNPDETAKETTPKITVFNKTRVNLATDPLTADLFDFCAEFGGKTFWLTKDGKPIEVPENATAAQIGDIRKNITEDHDLVHVEGNMIAGATGTEIIYGNAGFLAPDLAFDYGVRATAANPALKDHQIELTVAGPAAVLTAAQKTALGTSKTHFVAFRVLGFASLYGVYTDATTTAQGVKVAVTDAEGTGLKNIDVVVPVDGSTTSFEIALTSAIDASQIATLNLSLYVNLDGVVKDFAGTAAKASAEVKAGSTFTIDKGGVYTVDYTLTSGEFPTELDKYGVNVNATSKTVKNVKDGATSVDPEDLALGKYGAKITNNCYIQSVERSTDGKTLTVKYWFNAINLASVTTSNTSYAVSLSDDKGAVLASTMIYLDFVVGETPANGVVKLADNVYAKADGASLIVFKTYSDLDDVRSTTAALDNMSLNIQNTMAQSYNVGFGIGADGALTLADENTLSRASDMKLVTFGNVNDVNDRDREALFIMALDLTAIGVRSSDKAATYHFTMNEDNNQRATSYIAYQVTGNVITPHTLDATTAGWGTEVSFQDLDCVTDGIKGYVYTYSYDVEGTVVSGTFRYAALLTVATGQHSWTAKAGSATIDECTVCHYTRETNGNVYTIMKPVEEVVNADDNDAWWAGPAVGVTGNLSGDFILEYKWTNTRDGFWYQDVVLELTDGVKYFDINFFANNAWATDAGALWSGTSTDAPTKNGTDVSATRADVFKQGEAAEDGTPILGTEKRWEGSYTARLSRNGTTLTIVQTMKNTADETYVVTNTYPNFTTDTLTAQLVGNPYWVDEITKQVGETQLHVGQIKVGNTNYDISKQAAQAVEIVDTDAGWQEGPPRNGEYVLPAGDFTLVYEWDNVRDVNWWDAWIELTDGVGYYSAPVLEPNGNALNTWGGLAAEGGAVTTSSYTVDGEALETPIAGGTENAFGGHYVVSLVRLGTTFVMEVKLTRTWTGADGAAAGDNSVVVATRTTTGFTTGALTVYIIGNAFWIDNVSVARAYVSPVVTRS